MFVSMFGPWWHHECNIDDLKFQSNLYPLEERLGFLAKLILNLSFKLGVLGSSLLIQECFYCQIKKHGAGVKRPKKTEGFFLVTIFPRENFPLSRHSSDRVQIRESAEEQKPESTKTFFIPSETKV